MMSEESTTPNPAELAALFRAAIPDGTDMAHVARDDAAWATYSQTFATLLAPDFVYEDNEMPDHVGETYRGTEGFRTAFATFTEPFEEVIYDLERIVGSGDRVVSIHRVRATARHTGISFDLQVAYVWSFRGGRVVRIRGFRDPDKALEAVGLEA